MALRRHVLWLVMFALVTAQALGLMHRVVHAPHHAPATAAVSHEGGHWVAHLFEGHADDSSCRLFDPLNHDGMPTVAAVLLPAAVSTFFIDVFQGEFLARWAALYDARGPPFSR